MIMCRTKKELREHIRDMRGTGKTTGFVPTMGYLHEGHASLLRACRSNNEIAVASIFVNPMQFGPNEDFDQYPRSEEKDIELASSCGIDILFIPTVAEMYPKRPLTEVKVAGLTEQLCGASRPGHFDGVGLVVSKLFHLVEPDFAYFGLKDAQQIAVIEQMVRDLDMPVEIVKCPIIREPDGLALSSRNVYLTADERARAIVLNKACSQALEMFKEKTTTGRELLEYVTNQISQTKEARIDYVSLLTYPSLQVIDMELDLHNCKEQLLLAVAVYFGQTRLIDNQLLTCSEEVQYV